MRLGGGTALAHVCLFRLQRAPHPGEWHALRAFEERFRDGAGCVHYRFHENASRKSAMFELVLMSVFRDAEALRAYVASDAHADIARLMDGFVADTVVADFEDELGPAHRSRACAP